MRRDRRRRPRHITRAASRAKLHFDAWETVHLRVLVLPCLQFRFSPLARSTSSSTMRMRVTAVTENAFRAGSLTLGQSFERNAVFRHCGGGESDLGVGWGCAVIDAGGHRRPNRGRCDGGIVTAEVRVAERERLVVEEMLDAGGAGA